MGNSCAKGPPHDDGASGEADKPNGDKASNFRDRRLSVSQVPSDNSPARRLSVYNDESDEPPAQMHETIPSCSVKSVAGMEPVPGGSTRKINQDRALAIYPYNGDDTLALMGVFDGHGKLGEHASQFVIDQLPTTLHNHPDYPTDRKAALRQAFVDVDRALGRHVDASVSGTTAVACLMQGQQMQVANCGDSRAIIARRQGGKLVAHDLTIDQKPDTPAEKVRIEKMGGRVSPAAADGTPSRVWHNFRGLAMARSIGDHNAKTIGVIAEPEVIDYTLQKDDALLIIASDGVWEFLSSQDVCDIANEVENDNNNSICDRIVFKAAESWEREEGDYRDDITAVVLSLPWLKPA